MAYALADAATAAGHRLVAFDAIGSTQGEALERARAGERGPLWLVAGVQTAGRGRRGSTWRTPRGNLAATLLWTEGTGLPAAIVATLGFVAGVALVRAMGGPGVRGASPALKWPNDILVDGAKLAGILLERESVTGGHAVAIGMGVNVAEAPAGLPYPTAALADVAPGATAEALFTQLSAAWAEAEALWDRGRGFPAIRREWLARAAGLGGPVAVRLGARVLRGTFETIDEAGQLVVRGADGAAHAVAAGEVHFGSAATAALDDDATTAAGAAMPAA